MRLPVLGAVLLAACSAQTQPPATPKFEDIAAQAGLTVPHIHSADKRYFIEPISGGAGFIDCDNDGKLDILTVNGSSAARYIEQSGDPMVTLYHQGADLKFTDITQPAGLTRKGFGMGLAVADFDNDGRQDFIVTGFNGNALYRNLGNCKFEDVTEKAGLQLNHFNAGPAWGDYDRDGFVDLFIPGYVLQELKPPEANHREKLCPFKGIMVACGPYGLAGEPDFLFHNRGDGRFEDVSKRAGVDDPEHQHGLQGVWADYDSDGWPDLYVANDGQANFLYHNKHDGTFEDVGLIAGAAMSFEGREQGSMGVDFGDFDHDGRLDIFVTNFADEPNALYWNQGDKGFTEMIWPSGMAPVSVPLVGWGTGFVDLDNDGWPDVLVANGHVYPQVDEIQGPGVAGFRQPLLLFRNKRNRTFENISSVSGMDMLPLESRRGVAFGDVNNDGKVDVLILNVDAPPTLLLNRTATPNHSVLIRLVGSKSNRAGIGARVTVAAGDLVQFNEVRGGGSYMSQNDLRLHFGLEAHDRLDTVSVSWPSGGSDTYKALPADFIYTLTEGGGIEKVPLAKGTR
jgi:hypothetical protein